MASSQRHLSGFVKTPLVEKQIPEQARDLGLTEEQVVKQVMLRRLMASSPPPSMWRKSRCYSPAFHRMR